MAGRLDGTWKAFASGLEERSSVLALSTLFHQKAEGYMENVASWSQSCEIQQVSSDIPVLESGIHHHQSLYEGMCQAYTEVKPKLTYYQTWINIFIKCFIPIAQVHSTSKKLLYQLDHLVQLTNQSPNESPQKKHVSLSTQFLFH